MPRIRGISNWPSPTRIAWVFFASMLLSIVGVAGRNLLTYTHRTVSGATQYHLGALVAMAVAICGLAALSWTEQRPGRSFLEAISAAAGFIVPTSIAVRHAVPTGYHIITAVLILVLFTMVRLISLVVVRAVFHKLVLSTTPLCDRCGYDLIGNVSGVCPECGQRLGGPVGPTG
jgi:hypothetical protein